MKTLFINIVKHQQANNKMNVQYTGCPQKNEKPLK
jgi:hypothetical protein